MIKEQFINSCPKNLSIFLKERPTIDLKEIAKAAEQYLSAHQCELSDSHDAKQFKFGNKPKSEEDEKKCYNCNGRNHKASECKKPKGNQAPNNSWRNTKSCSYCKKTGHEVKDCWKKTKAAVGYETETDPLEENDGTKEVNSAYLVDEKRKHIMENINDNCLKLANGETIPVITNVCKTSRKKEKMPVTIGLVNNQEVKCLRDTGCNGIVVRQKLVQKEQYTGEYGYMLLVDNTVRKAPKAVIRVDSPYLKGEVQALCLPDVIYDLIIGNIPQALPPDRPLENWKSSPKVKELENKVNSSENMKIMVNNENKVISSENKKIKVSNENNATIQTDVEVSTILENDLHAIDSEKLKDLQKEDETVQNCLKNKNKEYIKENGIVFKNYQKQGVENLKKIVLPKKLRNKVMNIGHDTPMAGHLGFKKTLNRIRQHFS